MPIILGDGYTPVNLDCPKAINKKPRIINPIPIRANHDRDSFNKR